MPVKTSLSRAGAVIVGALMLFATSAVNAVPIVFQGDLTNGAVQNGAMPNGTLSSPHLWHFWTFSAATGDNITITALRDPTGSANDPVMSLWFGTETDTLAYSSLTMNSTNTMFITSADDEIPDPGPFGDPQINYVAANTGVYSVALSEHLGPNTICFDGVDQLLCEYTIQVTGLTASSILEPGSLAILGLGLVGLGFARRRKST